MLVVEVGDCVKGFEFVDVCLLWIGNIDVGVGGVVGGLYWFFVVGVEIVFVF